MSERSGVRTATIWKSSLQTFLAEVVNPVYLISVCERVGNDSMEMVTFVVYLTGFNEQDRALGLRLQRPAIPAVFDSHVECERQANLAVLKDIRARLDKLSRPYRDGMVSEKPVAGEVD